jgi:hypothetical protein
MSWIFAISKKNENVHKIDASYHSEPLFVISTPKFYLAVGGNPDTCFWENNIELQCGWAVVGTGILRKDQSVSILAHTAWSQLMTNETFNPNLLDGHFVALRWKGNRIECFSDQLGLRTLYYSKLTWGVCLSTELNWIAYIFNSTKIDFASLGDKWLMYNQLSYESCIVGIDRLGPHEHAIFLNGSLIHSTNTPWLPSFELSSISEATNILKAFISSALCYKYNPSLGLSGGMDSRVLLALFLDNSKYGFDTYTFGEPLNPDVQIAKLIATSFGLPHNHFNDPLPDIETCISSISTFVSQTFLTEPCSSFLKLRYYPKLHKIGRLMIDGGFGEIARRQYLNRIVRFGRSAIRGQDICRIFKLMQLTRADIFSHEVKTILESGAKQSLEKVLSEMPPVEKIGVENFADLLAVRTRVPNFGSPEQGRIDKEVINFMPLVQPSFLRAVFGLPVKIRSNSGFYRSIIHSLNPVLCKIPLVKSGFTHKFGFSTNMILLSYKVKSKINKAYHDAGPDLVFTHLKEWILDIVHSTGVTTNPIYDTRKVISSVSKYYKGELNLRKTVDWWLTFELWNRSLSCNDKNKNSNDELPNCR